MFRWPYNWRKMEECPYWNIPHLGGFVYQWDCFAENLYIKYAGLPEMGIYHGTERDVKITVSLTTFPKRIDACYYAIKSLMIQSVQADQIELWLSKEQFADRNLPEKYEELLKRGLKIRYCDDLRSHKKYYYALQEQKEKEVVITFDDDIIYEKDAIEKLVTLHKQFPDCIICNRGHHMKMQSEKLLPYKTWNLCSAEGVKEPNMAIMPSTGAGCLYPYNVMPQTTFDKNLIRQCAWTADDLWMRFNSLTAGVPVVKTREKIATLCNVYSSQKEALTNINDLQDENQRTIERLLIQFPETLDILKGDR